MAGRPPLTIGTNGKITTREITPPGTPRGQKVWQASTYYRDADGTTRRVKRTGPSKNAAETALKEALTKRRHTSGAEIDGSTKLADAAARWLAVRRADMEAGNLAPRTVETYASAMARHVLPALGQLRLREVTTARCEAWMLELRKRLSAEMCRTSRAVLSGILGYAARMEAIPTNPISDISPVPGGRKRKPRAMTAEERAAWLSWMDSNVAAKPRKPGEPAPRPHHRTPEQILETAKGRALGDITRLMLGTGCRIGEAMALSWDEIDFTAGTVDIRWHIVRVTGKGLVRMPGAKSEAGDRTLRVPDWTLDMLLRRRTEPDSGWPVFPDQNGGWRDPNLVVRWIRWSRAEAGFDWVTSHVFRQTVITVLDEAGLSTREVADHVGHSRIMQTQSYMARGVASERAAEALEGLL